MKNYILLIIICCSFVACNQKTAVTHSVTEETLNEYDSIYSDKDDPMGTVTDLNVSDGILIAKHMSDIYAFSFIDTNGKCLLRRWGQIGEAADELIDFGGAFEVHDTLLTFDEVMKKNLVRISLKQLLADEPDIHLQREPYPYTVDFRPMNFCSIGRYKVFTGYFQDKRLGIVDENGQILGCASDYPIHNDGMDDLNKSMLYQSQIKSAPSSDRFVLYTFISDLFEIYRISPEGTLERTFLSSASHTPQIYRRGDRYVIDDSQSEAGFLKMSLTEQHIYFSHSSQKYEKVAKSNWSTQEVLCYNWDGTLSVVYQIPFPIGAFCVDGQYLYAVRYQGDETIFYRFRL